MNKVYEGKVMEIEVLSHPEGYDVYKNYYTNNEISMDNYGGTETAKITKTKKEAMKLAKKLAKKYDCRIEETV